jgi:alkanesulfonate monooxygenase SsuD/methylene tetrahydromethanopterin reductase-like flavin-dependent oxidoreductase (luciferase family)
VCMSGETARGLLRWADGCVVRMGAKDMKFGVSLFGHHSLDRSSIENFESVLALARTARDANFDLVSAGQHYLVEHFQKFQPKLALARASAETGDMLINILDLVPLNHPVRLAEELATLDAMTGGRVVFTPLLGYSQHEFDAFGISKKTRRGRLLESVELIKRLWAEDNVTFEGKYYQVHNATINPKPVQKPRPAIWMPADSTKGIIRAAETGDAWLISNHGRIAEVKEQLEVYWEHRKGREPESNNHGITLPMMRVACIAETQEEALRIGRPHIEDTWRRFYGQFGQADEMDDPEDFTQEFDDLWKDRFLFTTPEGCIQEIERYQRELGIDFLMISLAGSREEKLRSLELIGREVVPHFKQPVVA